jgi:hypothetical protein
MTQTNPQISPAAYAGAPQNSAGAIDPQTDALLHLHKMSMTAGLGAQDYVAVSITAVVAVLFGLASLLAIVSWVMLVIPLTGVALSVTALRQINHSNGTLTGRGLAYLGLILSGAITLGIFTVQTVQQVRRRDDSKAIAALCQKYGEDLDRRDFDSAYALFDSAFQTRVPIASFKAHLAGLQQGAMTPPIDRAEWNGLAQFTQGDEGIQTAEAVMKVHYKGMDEEMGRFSIRFRKEADAPWLIDNIPDQFQGSKKRPGG